MFVTRNEAWRGVCFYGVAESLIFFITVKFAFSSSVHYACEGRCKTPRCLTLTPLPISAQRLFLSAPPGNSTRTRAKASHLTLPRTAPFPDWYRQAAVHRENTLCY